MVDSNINSSEALIKTLLIKTKLSPPQLRAFLVDRAQIKDRLSKSLNQPPCVVLVSAPPGYGKTVTIVDWLRHSPLSYGWLTLDRSDNDPTRFAGYLLAALEKISNRFGGVTKSLLGTAQSSAPELLGTSLVHDLARITEPFVLVLDDYHMIRNGFIHGLVQFLIDNQPPLLSILILTREDPPLAFARIKLQNRMVELRTSDLRFTLDEMKSFYRNSMQLDLEDQSIEALDVRIEGWIAGLQLVGLTMQEYGSQKCKEVIDDFTGSNRYVVDYFAEEVLEQQSNELRDFLVKTALLDRFCPELCDSIRGRSDSRSILRELEQNNYFLVPLDENRKWFRYHSLFADFLKTQLDKGESSDLLVNAVRWFEENNLIGDAVRHSILLGDDREKARLIKKGSRWAITTGQYITLLRWLQSLSEDTIRRSVDLSVYRAWAFFLTGQVDLAEESVSEIEKVSSRDMSDRNKGRCMSLKTWISFIHGEQMDSNTVHTTFRLLGEKDSIFSVFAILALGFVLFGEGCTDKSQATFRKAYYRCQQLGNLTLAMCSLHNMASVLLEQGRRSEAERQCLRELKNLEETFGGHPPVADIILIPMAYACYLANELNRAEELASRAAIFTGQFDLSYLLFDNAERTLALVALAAGRPEDALTIIRSHQKAHTYPATSRMMSTLEADIAIMLGNAEFAERWSSSRHIASSNKLDMWSIHDYITLGKLLVRQNRLEEAETLLMRIGDLTEKSHRVGSLLTVRILQATVFGETGREEEARRIMEQAIMVAYDEGYKRPFLDQWQKIGSLLSKLRNMSPHFISELINEHREEAAAVSSVAPIPLASGDLETLSRREQEVLKCISEGLSNTDIAERLYISVGTVKWHINNIFGKLDAKSRTQAIIRARELGLL